MHRLAKAIAVAVFVGAVLVPAAAFAGESEYVRLTAGYDYANSPSTAGKYTYASQGSVEQGGVSPMLALIQNRSSSVYPFITREVETIPAGGAASSSKGWATSMYWRLRLTDGGVAAGYGVLNAK